MSSFEDVTTISANYYISMTCVLEHVLSVLLCGVGVVLSLETRPLCSPRGERPCEWSIGASVRVTGLRTVNTCLDNSMLPAATWSTWGYVVCVWVWDLHNTVQRRA